MRGAVVERRRGERRQQPHEARHGIVGEVRIGHVALPALHGDEAGELPRRPIFTISPSALGLVGSPTMQWSMTSPLAASQSTTLAVPSMEGPSSSPVRGRRGCPAPARHKPAPPRGRPPPPPSCPPPPARRARRPPLRRRRGRAARTPHRPAHHVHMAGEAEIGRGRTDAGIEIVHRHAGRREDQPFHMVARRLHASATTSSACPASGVTDGA